MITSINEFKQSIKTRAGGEAYSLIMGRELKPKLKELLDKYRSSIGIGNIDNRNAYNTRQMTYTHTFEINFRDVIMADIDMNNIKNLINDLENFCKDNDFRSLGVTLKRGGRLNNDVITQKIEDVLNINPANHYKLSFNFWMIANDSIQVEVNEKKGKKKAKKQKKAKSKKAKDFISDKIKSLSEEGVPHKQAIAMSYSFAEKEGLLESTDNSEPIEFEKLVKMDRLEEFADGLKKMCMGEYGDLYYNADLKKIIINLGDGNPFEKYETLQWWLEENVYDDYSNGVKQIDVEIDCEWGPNPAEEGWMHWNGKKFIKK